VLRLDDHPEEAPPAMNGLTVPLEEETKRPSFARPPELPPSAGKLAIAGSEEELRVILLDETSNEPPLEVEAPSERKTSLAPAAWPTDRPAASREAPADGEELRVVLLDDSAASEIAAPATKPFNVSETSKRPIKESAEAVSDDADVSALLIAGDVAPISELVRPREPPAAPSETEYVPAESLIDGKSSLLLGAGQATGPTTVEELPGEPRRGRRPRRERVRIVPPKDGAPIEWFSNADACAIYCRKHRRPLLLYFTTGDVEQCQTYEEAIRRQEIQPFLSSYVCCLVNMAQIEGRKVAMRLGVPTDGPAIVVLSPSGREYARVLKPQVDWRFVATMLFWGLR
jgi:hypothetical protein